MPTYTKLPSGNWRVQVRKTGHRPVSKTFGKKAEAKDWAEQMTTSPYRIEANSIDMLSATNNKKAYRLGGAFGRRPKRGNHG
jgi:hypothetical protein